MARAREVSNPDGMLAVNQVTETARLADQAPLELTTHHIAQPPVAVPAIVEHDLRMARAREVSNPDRMLAVDQVTETARLADQAPLQLTTCHIAQPPVAVPAVVEHYLRMARAREVSDPDGMLAVNQVTETARLADQAPLQWQHLRGQRASLLRVRPFCLDEKAPEARRLAVADVTYFLAGARIPPRVQFRVGDCLSKF